MKKYELRFCFVDTEEEAIQEVFKENSTGTRYKRKNRPAHYTPWSSLDGRENKFIVWYYV